MTQLLRRQHRAKRAFESVAGMPYPTKNARQYDFQSYQVSNPTQPVPLWAPNGWKLQATTHNAEGFHVTAIGADA